MLRLRRTAHQHHRRGTCGSPCPQSLRSFAGSTPSGGYRPPLRRPPQTFNNRGVLLQATKRALAQDPKGQSRARSGGRFACKLADATATAPAGRNARYRCHRMPCAASKGPWAARRKSRQAPTLYRSLSRVFRINMQLS